MLHENPINIEEILVETDKVAYFAEELGKSKCKPIPELNTSHDMKRYLFLNKTELTQTLQRAIATDSFAFDNEMMYTKEEW